MDAWGGAWGDCWGGAWGDDGATPAPRREVVRLASAVTRALTLISRIG